MSNLDGTPLTWTNKDDEIVTLRKQLAEAQKALTMIQFIGTKGTARIWPDSVLKECVGVAMNALKERE